MAQQCFHIGHIYIEYIALNCRFITVSAYTKFGMCNSFHLEIASKIYILNLEKSYL